jgi:hypothetical protein
MQKKDTTAALPWRLSATSVSDQSSDLQDALRGNGSFRIFKPGVAFASREHFRLRIADQKRTEWDAIQCNPAVNTQF